MKAFDIKFLKKRAGENEAICRAEPTMQAVREVCLVLQIKLSKARMESFGTFLDEKLRANNWHF